MNSPTDKQIAFVDTIAYTLNIDFPTCAKDFTRKNYSNFIKKYIDDFASYKIDEENLYNVCDNDVWTEFY